jgi:hypothetical protein
VIDPAAVRQVRVVAKFFGVRTNGQDGLGATYPGAGGDRVPMANVRIGFAFHTNPADPNGTRLPASGFYYDLESIPRQVDIGGRGMPFVQWDITFDSRFARAGSTDEPPALGPDSPRPELQFLRLPFRF